MTDSPPLECRVDLDESDGHLASDRLGFDPEELDRPLLVWDGDCGFCRRSLEYIRDRAGDHLHYAPFQHVHRYFDGIDQADFERGVHLVEPDGLHYSGAEAIFRALGRAPDDGTWQSLYDRVPGFSTLTERVYRFVADNRPLVSRISRWLFGSDLRRSRFRFARWLALRLLVVACLIAVVSLGVQVLGPTC